MEITVFCQLLTLGTFALSAGQILGMGKLVNETNTDETSQLQGHVSQEKMITVIDKIMKSAISDGEMSTQGQSNFDSLSRPSVQADNVTSVKILNSTEIFNLTGSFSPTGGLTSSEHTGQNRHSTESRTYTTLANRTVNLNSEIDDNWTQDDNFELSPNPLVNFTSTETLNSTVGLHFDEELHSNENHNFTSIEKSTVNSDSSEKLNISTEMSGTTEKHISVKNLISTTRLLTLKNHNYSVSLKNIENTSNYSAWTVQPIKRIDSQEKLISKEKSFATMKSNLTKKPSVSSMEKDIVKQLFIKMTEKMSSGDKPDEARTHGNIFNVSSKTEPADKSKFAPSVSVTAMSDNKTQLTSFLRRSVMTPEIATVSNDRTRIDSVTTEVRSFDQAGKYGKYAKTKSQTGRLMRTMMPNPDTTAKTYQETNGGLISQKYNLTSPPSSPDATLMRTHQTQTDDGPGLSNLNFTETVMTHTNADSAYAEANMFNNSKMIQVDDTQALISDHSASVSMEPDTAKPDTTMPDTTKPDTTMPDTTKPDCTKPDTTKPDTTKPDTTKPDTTMAYTYRYVKETHHLLENSTSSTTMKQDHGIKTRHIRRQTMLHRPDPALTGKVESDEKMSTRVASSKREISSVIKTVSPNYEVYTTADRDSSMLHNIQSPRTTEYTSTAHHENYVTMRDDPFKTRMMTRVPNLLNEAISTKRTYLSSKQVDTGLHGNSVTTKVDVTDTDAAVPLISTLQPPRYFTATAAERQMSNESHVLNSVTQTPISTGTSFTQEITKILPGHRPSTTAERITMVTSSMRSTPKPNKAKVDATIDETNDTPPLITTKLTARTTSQTSGDLISCSGHPCQNGGTCVERNGQMIKCTCAPIYTGVTCDKLQPFPRNVTAHYTTEHSITVTWQHPQQKGSQITGFVVQYYRFGDDDVKHSMILHQTVNIFTVRDLLSNNQYTVCVCATTENRIPTRCAVMRNQCIEVTTASEALTTIDLKTALYILAGTVFLFLLVIFCIQFRQWRKNRRYRIPFKTVRRHNINEFSYNITTPPETPQRPMPSPVNISENIPMTQQMDLTDGNNTNTLDSFRKRPQSCDDNIPKRSTTPPHSNAQNEFNFENVYFLPKNIT